CQAVIAERQSAIDDDAGEAATVRDGFVDELRRRGHRPDFDAVWIPAAVAAAVVNAATGERYAVNRAGAVPGPPAIPEIRKSKHGSFGRGWAWRGLKCHPSEPLTPLEDVVASPWSQGQ